MSNPEIKIGQLWRHYKGNHYEIFALGKHSETGDELVGYKRREDGKVYFRPKNMFFDIVDFNNQKIQRFIFVENVSSHRNKYIELYGWYGAVGLLGAYALSSFNIFSSENVWYQVINITAALGIVTVSFHKKNYQPGVLNIVWAIVGLVALVKILI